MSVLFSTQNSVTLVGGAGFSTADLDLALTLAPELVAADGGANSLVDAGHLPQAIIGDIDSLRDDLRHQLADKVHRIAEQDSTDFDKCLAFVNAPFILALGFTGARLDHTLAAMSSLVRFGSARVLVVAEKDITFLAPPRLTLPATIGQRVSLFPMGRCAGRSQGLFWPIDGLDFTPSGVIGTSNKASSTQVTLEFDSPDMLVLLPRAQLQDTITALTATPDWPRT
ncbi:thiamine diphosphokinase [Roseinatronobacter alkalisoli]|uniref:Thiamine diphosphokinase n=1 Tax=Roseinatronobacter alkalisoli TaxID=3028235 RepID=A0ABT5TAC1_9RHOB|nr:thiamine diphosphokinase [Roseinatronobacter sp. HJB301]MDD7972075.1 thiamine diphosphokinase [Roseinatronobacter sp. HJB301]